MLFFNVFKYVVKDSESADVLYHSQDEHNQQKGRYDQNAIFSYIVRLNGDELVKECCQ